MNECKELVWNSQSALRFLIRAAVHPWGKKKIFQKFNKKKKKKSNLSSSLKLVTWLELMVFVRFYQIKSISALNTNDLLFKIDTLTVWIEDSFVKYLYRFTIDNRASFLFDRYAPLFLLTFQHWRKDTLYPTLFEPFEESSSP